MLGHRTSPLLAQLPDVALWRVDDPRELSSQPLKSVRFLGVEFMFVVNAAYAANDVT